ncbi:MAG TPA: alkaline phosphatase D family protein [Bryobacteraceae bacterium]|nr:alkaline phosphatase D family protein [Bryobacteraceae bacterium]
MNRITRRDFLTMAAAFGASLAWRSADARTSQVSWRERRDLYPQGVASGDPYPDSVILWTRRPPSSAGEARELLLEVSEDSTFSRVAATASASVSPETDWTCRVLAANLKPRHQYWYRFTDEHGFGSRVGRTLTAPSVRDSRPVRFTFVSCQNVTQGACNAYRRMIYEDERKPASDQLGFVLHLGDFIYEITWYPEDRPQGMYARRLRDVYRYAQSEKIEDFHVPTTVDDYRAAYRGYLLDPDLQDARARWPFVCMWDNHEFSWKGWQSFEDFGSPRPSQTRKVAAAQAWYEYQPARVVKANPNDDRYLPPDVRDAPVTEFDANGLGEEAGNLAAINSLKLYRSFHYGRNVDLILTDNRSFRSQPVVDMAGTSAFRSKDFPYVFSQDVIEILDAGKTYNHGHPPTTIVFGGKELSNFRKDAAASSMLGEPQKTWFLEQLHTSRAPWKLWGNSVGMLDWRTDFQNLPEEIGLRWPDSGYAAFAADDWAGYRTERNQILNFLSQQKITGMVTVAGDRHAFFAGLLSSALPPDAFQPVAAEFIVGSVSAPTIFEAVEYRLPKDHLLRAAYLYQPADGGGVQPAMNLSAMRGVRASLALQETGDPQKARAASNPDVGPHLSFLDAGGHGYALVHARRDSLDVEFVCLPRPLERSTTPDGGPLAYRVTHRLKRWSANAAPQVERTAFEGRLPLVL